jgi:phage terminase Nu1 subunit (DNA packaging protein)
MSDDEHNDHDDHEGNEPIQHGGNAQANVNRFRLTAEQKQQFDITPENGKLQFLWPIVSAKINEEPFADIPAYQLRIQEVIEGILISAKGQATDEDILNLLAKYAEVRDNAEISRVEDEFRIMGIDEQKKEISFIKELGKDGLKLNEVKETKMTSAMIEIALQTNGNALQYISFQRRTPEMIKLAIRTTPAAIRWIGTVNQTLEYAELAFRDRDPEGLKYIRKDLLEALLILKASAQPPSDPPAQPLPSDPSAQPPSDPPAQPPSDPHTE